MPRCRHLYPHPSLRPPLLPSLLVLQLFRCHFKLLLRLIPCRWELRRPKLAPDRVRAEPRSQDLRVRRGGDRRAARADARATWEDLGGCLRQGAMGDSGTVEPLQELKFSILIAKDLIVNLVIDY